MRSEVVIIFFFTHVHYSNIVQLLIYIDLYIRLWNEHILADLYCDVLLVDKQ